MKQQKVPVKQYLKLSHELIKSPRYNKLTHPAKIILNYSMLFFYDDQPEHGFALSYSEINRELHISKDTIKSAIKQLIDSRYWYLVSAGSRNKSATYRHNHLLLGVQIE